MQEYGCINRIMFSFKYYNFLIVQIIGIELMIIAIHFLERGIYSAFISVSTPKFLSSMRETI